MPTPAIKSLLILLVIFSGCQSTGKNQTQAQQEMDAVVAIVTESNKKHDECSKAIGNDEAVRKVHDEIIYEREESPNKFTLMTSAEKLTDSQGETLKAAIPLFQKCRNIARTELRGLPFQLALLKLHNENDFIYLRLLRKEVTIGEANEMRAKALSEYQKEWAKTAGEVEAQLRAAHYSEIQNRQAAAAAALPLLMQQQALQQQTLQHQQAMQQQQLQNMLNNTTRPTTYTNCTRYGNQVNCTSR